MCSEHTCISLWLNLTYTQNQYKQQIDTVFSLFICDTLTIERDFLLPATVVTNHVIVGHNMTCGLLTAAVYNNINDNSNDNVITGLL